MLTVRHNPSAFEKTIASAFADVKQGVTPEADSLPSMTTPVTIVTTPEDVALTVAALNATTAVLNYAAATRK